MVYKSPYNPLGTRVCRCLEGCLPYGYPAVSRVGLLVFLMDPGHKNDAVQNGKTKQQAPQPGTCGRLSTVANNQYAKAHCQQDQKPNTSAAATFCHVLTVGHLVTNMHTSGTAYRYIQGAGAAADTRSRSAA